MCHGQSCYWAAPYENMLGWWYHTLVMEYTEIGMLMHVGQLSFDKCGHVMLPLNGPLAVWYVWQPREPYGTTILFRPSPPLRRPSMAFFLSNDGEKHHRTQELYNIFGILRCELRGETMLIVTVVELMPLVEKSNPYGIRINGYHSFERLGWSSRERRSFGKTQPSTVTHSHILVLTSHPKKLAIIIPTTAKHVWWCLMNTTCWKAIRQITLWQSNMARITTENHHRL